MTIRIVKLISIFIILLVLTGLLVEKCKRDTINQNIKDFGHIEFSGIVTNKKFATGSNCLIEAKLNYSSIKEYDIRKSLKAYFCVIKNKKAEIVLSCFTTKVGDSIVFKNNIFTIYSENEINTHRPFVKHHMNVYKEIGKLHEL